MASAEFDELLNRVVDRLKHLDEARLGRIEKSARQCVQSLADQVAEIEGRTLRVVPDDGLLVLGDQMAVMGNDLMATKDESAISQGLVTLREFKKALDGV